jgi:hypothetical protein
VFSRPDISGNSARPRSAEFAALRAEERRKHWLRNYFWVVNCQSIVIGNPTIDILEGPEEIEVTVKPEKILPRAQNCAKEVPGGHVVASAKEITERKEGKLTIRLNFNTKQGERQASESYLLSLFP